MDMDGIMKKVGDGLNVARDLVMDFTDKAGKKAGEVYDVAKLKIKLADIRRDINSLYKAIGVAAYDALQAGDDIAAAISEKCAEIQRLNNEIADLEEEVKSEAGELSEEAEDADEETAEEAVETTVVDED